MSSTISPIQAISRHDRAHPPLAAARRSCIVIGCIALILTLVLLALPRPAVAQAISGEATLIDSGGYGRLLLKFPVEVPASVRLTGSIMVIQFKSSVDVSVQGINAGARDYVAAARRDPDGRALRFALARKVRIDTIALGERLYVDLLPDSWTAAPPPPPQEVIEELARRARDAERAERQKAELAVQRKVPAVRVRVATQPTFTRYVFELPELTGVSTDRGKDDLTLSFAAPLRFDLADVKLASPPAVGSVESSLEKGVAAVKFTFAGKVDIRSFREDNNYVVDVTPLEAAPRRVEGKAKSADAPRLAATAAPPTDVDAPETIPTPDVVAPAGINAKPDAPPPSRAAPAVLPILAAAQPPAVTPAAAHPKPEAEAGKTVAAAPAAPASATVANETAPMPPPMPQVQPAARAADVPPGDSARPIAAELRRVGENLRMRFDFPEPTPAAVFQRADTLWLVFDTPRQLDVAGLNGEDTHTVRSAAATPADGAQVVRIKLTRARLISVAADKTSWVVTLGDTVVDPSRQMLLSRNVDGVAQTSLKIGFNDPRRVHHLADAEAGDKLIVVTGLGPARGILRTYDFVEFRILPSTQGLAVQPYADDVDAELMPDKVLLGRPGGLTLSDLVLRATRVGLTRPATFDAKHWSEDGKADFNGRQFDLLNAAASASTNKRSGARLDLARFYLARQMYVEAKAVLDVALADEAPNAADPSALVLRAISNIMLDRVEPALKDLANPLIGGQRATRLWRGLAYAREGKWTEARENFRKGGQALAALPAELQRLVLTEDLRAAIETGDLATATAKSNELTTIGTSPDQEPSLAVLMGRLAQGMGRNAEALGDYGFAAASPQRPAAAKGKLREISLRYAMGKTTKPEAINDLETLVAGWRGDDTEAEALQMLAHLYTEERRYRDAFRIMHTALLTHPNSDLTRRIQDEAAGTFDSLFLAGGGDALPAIDALSLFYDYRELVPIGRRGDEMIRRLADRLISVDLLDQAAELLQHQVDNRLQGAARAQVASKLAVVYLLAHKPDRAQAVLRATRAADLSNNARSQRLLIEGRALSDGGRHDLALEVIANVDGREAIRLRADIQWAAQRWQKAAEQLELLHAGRAGRFEPLSDLARSDILRAGIGYAMADDALGISRLREKFGARMADSADSHAFEVVTGGLGVNSVEFGEVAHRVAAVDTLDGFLRDLHMRYPEAPALSAETAGASSATGSVAPRRRSRPVQRVARDKA